MYEMDSSFSSSQAHMGIKRDFGAHGKRAEDDQNVTLPDAPLFEKYQYFTPGSSFSFSLCSQWELESLLDR